MAGYLTLLDVWAEIDCPLYWPPISWNWDLFSIFETFIIFWSRRFLLRYQIYLIQSSTSFQEESNPPRKFHCLICGASCLRIAQKKKRAFVLLQLSLKPSQVLGNVIKLRKQEKYHHTRHQGHRKVPKTTKGILRQGRENLIWFCILAMSSHYQWLKFFRPLHQYDSVWLTCA